MKVIRIFNSQPVKIPHFKSLLTRKQTRSPHFLLHFFNVYIMNVNYNKFQKRLIVEKNMELPNVPGIVVRFGLNCHQ